MLLGWFQVGWLALVGRWISCHVILPPVPLTRLVRSELNENDWGLLETWSEFVSSPLVGCHAAIHIDQTSMSLLFQRAALEEPDLAQQVAPGLTGVSHLYEGAPPGTGNPPESHDNESDGFNHPS